jgi:hypothetical protein
MIGLQVGLRRLEKRQTAAGVSGRETALVPCKAQTNANELQCFELILLSKPRLFLLTAVLNHHAAQFCVHSDPTHDTPQYVHITQLKRRVKKNC